MKLIASGWRRHVSTRMLFDLNLSDAELGKDYPYSGVAVRQIRSHDDVLFYSEVPTIDPIPPAVGYRFRIHVGESTMGGDYSADLVIGADDVLAMFKQTFGHLALDELIDLLGSRAATRSKE